MKRLLPLIGFMDPEIHYQPWNHNYNEIVPDEEIERDMVDNRHEQQAAVKKQSAWVALYLKDSKEFVIAERSEHVRHSGEWNFFGGTVEKNESPIVTAKKELKEEAGISAKKKDLQFIGKGRTGDKVSFYYLYYLESIHLLRVNKESSRIKKVTSAKLKQMSNSNKLHTPTQFMVKHILPSLDL